MGFTSPEVAKQMYALVGIQSVEYAVRQEEIYEWHSMPSHLLQFGTNKPNRPCLRIMNANSSTSQVFPRTSQLGKSKRALKHQAHHHGCLVSKDGEVFFNRITLANHNFRLSLWQCVEIDVNWVGNFCRQIESYFEKTS